MVKRIVFLLVLTLGFGKIFAQELNCQVSVLTPQIQASDKSIYETLQTTIREFMNSRTWTTDQFLNQERIECSIIITISERASVDDFKAADLSIKHPTILLCSITRITISIFGMYRIKLWNLTKQTSIQI